MARIWVAPPFQDGCRNLKLDNPRAFSRFFGMEEPIGRKDVRLVRGTLQMPDRTVDVWYKQYDYLPGSWRYATRRSKARREFLSYEAMRRLGVQCAAPLACGEERDRLGRLLRAFIVTVEIPQALPLADFVRAHCSNGDDSTSIRAALIRELARITKKAHDGGFVHRDLWLRNVLVNWEAPNVPNVWLIDSPRGSVWRWLSRFGTMFDLASLNKGAADLSSRCERMRFLKEYAGGVTNGTLKKLARRVMNVPMYKKEKGVIRPWQQYVTGVFGQLMAWSSLLMMTGIDF